MTISNPILFPEPFISVILVIIVFIINQAEVEIGNYKGENSAYYGVDLGGVGKKECTNRTLKRHHKYFRKTAQKFWMRRIIFQEHYRYRPHEGRHFVPEHLHTALTSSDFLNDVLVFLLPPTSQKLRK